MSDHYRRLTTIIRNMFNEIYPVMLIEFVIISYVSVLGKVRYYNDDNRKEDWCLNGNNFGTLMMCSEHNVYISFKEDELTNMYKDTEICLENLFSLTRKLSNVT